MVRETIYSIANQYSVRIADLRNLNNIPYNVETVEPGTEIKIALVKTDDQNPNTVKVKQPVVIKHQVRAGESLTEIAENYKVSIDEIKIWNRLERAPKEGQYLKIISSNVESPKSPKKEETAEATQPKPKKSKKSTTKKKKVYHKVRRGESLSSIARKYRVSESDLKRWNPSAIKGNTIYYGTKLRVYSNVKVRSKSTKKSTKSKPKYYKVRWGDTLQSIGRKFGVSVRTLQKKNKNLSNANLKAGQRIRIQ